MHQNSVALPMNTIHSYTREELLALQEKLKFALGEREAVLGRAVIKAIGSVPEGKEVVIRANCFDGPNARILWKPPVWQWPLDVGISDGTRSLWLQGINRKPAEINFMPLPNITPEEGFPEMSPRVSEPRNSPPATT